MTAFESVESAREAVRWGASDYIVKPVDIDELRANINRELSYRTLQRENLLLKARLGEQFADSNIIARSAKMREVLENIALIAPSDATVVILGESGTGKELIANPFGLNPAWRCFSSNVLKRSGSMIDWDFVSHDSTSRESSLRPVLSLWKE